MKHTITTIAFDADDTLWANQSYYQAAEEKFCRLFGDIMPQEKVSQELFETDTKNIPLYGYGAKGFMLSMIETANRISAPAFSKEIIPEIIEIGRHLLDMPIHLLEGVEETLDSLKGSYNLVLATKGDLLDQQRKIDKSGLADYFEHIEIMSDKKAGNYEVLLRQLSSPPENFLMLGNSIKSDILPVLEIGGSAAHIPFYLTWAHEEHHEELRHENFVELERIDGIMDYLR